MLKARFLNSVGERWVGEGRYEIRDEVTGTAVKAGDWKDIVKPGMALSMAMLFRRQAAAGTTEHACPSCNRLYEGASSKELQRVVW